LSTEVHQYMRKSPADPITGVTPRVRARAEEIAELILVEGRVWDSDLVNELRIRWGVSQRTVYVYRKVMLSMHAHDLQEKREELRAEFLGRVKKAQKNAADSAPRALNGLLGIEAKVSGFYEPPPPPRGQDVSSEPMTEQEAVSMLADMPAHLLEAALAALAAKRAQDE